jgi:outer membrane receptor protein involved in Fe transport
MKAKIYKLKNTLISIIILMFLILMPSISYSQTTGSIGGTVVDALDKSPLPGAVVEIEGSNQGAITNDDGEFVILNVDVGIYDLESSYIGYNKNKITGVKVSVDTRTKADFELTSAEIQTEVIIVEAERKGIDVEQSGRLIESDQIERQGTRGITNIVSQTAGVVQNERGGTINVRGGRDNETVIIIDGVVTNNPIDGSTTNATVANSLIQEIAVLTGGFGAEYGNVLSGVINVTTKGGSDVFSGSIEAITDEFTGDWINTISQGYNLYNVTFGGPVIPSKDLARVINFYGGVERQWLGVRNSSWITDELFEDGIMPNYGQNSWFYSGRLNINLSEIKNSKVPIVLKFGALISNSEQRRFLTSFLKTNSYHNPFWDFDDKTFYGRLIHNISSNFFYELQGSYFNSIFERGDPFLRDQITLYGDTNHVPILPTQGAWSVPESTTGNVFQTAGVVYPRYEKNEVSYLGGKFDATLAILTKKYGDHELKFGGEYKYHTLKYMNVWAPPLASNSQDSLGNFLTPPRELWWSATSGQLNAYGYDITDQFGNVITNAEEREPKNPIIGALYLRDKVDFGDFTFNAGIRLDMLDVNDEVLIDPNNLYHKDGVLLSADDYEQSSQNITVSPRLGFSFPVTDKTVFVAQYGKFIQLPPLEFLYISKYAFQQFFAASVQNVAENSGLKPEKLTSYEVGIKQQLGNYVFAGVTAYYRETRDQIGAGRILGSPTVPNGYNIFMNNDFAISRGLEFYLSMRRFNRIALDIAYSLAYASGTGTDETSKSRLVNTSGAELPKFTYPLNFDQRHTGTINFDYRFGSTNVPKGFGGEILKNLGLNVLFSFNSGRPYTSRSLPTSAYSTGGAALSTKNGVTWQWNLRLDVKLDKTVSVWKTNWNFYIYVINLLNSEIINNVYGSTGLPDDNGYLNTPNGNIQTQLFKDNWKIRIQNPSYWGPPRQVQFGIRVNF